MTSRSRLTLAALAALAAVAPAAAQCPGEWTPLVARTGFDHPADIHGFVEWDRGGGAGPEVYAYGSFTDAGGVEVNSIARWDGQRWRPLDGGVTEPPGVASRINTAIVAAMGGQDVLVVGGIFQAAGGVPALGVAMHDGTGWRPLGEGLQQAAHGGDVQALAVYDDGGGPALYAAGDFAFSGFTILNNIARWDGAAWQPLEFFATGIDGVVNDMIVFDDGSGPKLVVGGDLTTVGGMPVRGIAAWDGAVWSRFGDGVEAARDLEVFPDTLYVMSTSGSGFSPTGTARRGSRWAARSWTGLARCSL